MGKVYDITDKLSYEEGPILKIKNVEIHVNDDAMTMVKVMGKLGASVSPKEIVEIYELIIPEADRKKVDKMKLGFADFSKVVKAAVTAVTGGDMDLEDDEEVE